MTTMEWIMLGSGFALLLLSGAWHLGGLLLIRRLKPATAGRPAVGVLLAFWGLAVLHFSEIAFAALVYSLALSIPGAGEIAGRQGTEAADLLYFSGISFATLGYTQQVATGAVRLLAMLQALGGFMLITWSAAFVYTLWDERFRGDQP